MHRYFRISIILLAVFVFQLHVFGLDAENEEGESMSLEPMYDRMTRHRSIKRVPTNYRGKLGVRWRRQNERGVGAGAGVGGRLKKTAAAHQNGHGPPLPPLDDEAPPEMIYLNSNASALYHSKEKQNKIGKNFRSWTEIESREEQTESKNVVVKSRESASMETKEAVSSEKLDDTETLGCEGLELCSGEVPTARRAPDPPTSRDKLADPTPKRKERLLSTRERNTTEVTPARHRGSIVPLFHTTESSPGWEGRSKKRRISSTIPTSVSTEVFPQTMSYSLYNHFRPIDQEVPQEAIMPFLDFGRKLAPPSGVNSLEISPERARRPSSTTARTEDDLHDEMDVTLDRKAVERNSAPKLRVRSRGSSIAGLFRKAAAPSPVLAAARIDCAKILKRRTFQHTDEYKQCLSMEPVTDNETSTDVQASNHKYSDDNEPPKVSSVYEIVNISNKSKSDDKLYHYEVEPSTTNSSEAPHAAEVTSGSEISTRVTSLTSSTPRRDTTTRAASRSPGATERSFGRTSTTVVTGKPASARTAETPSGEQTQRSYLDSSLLRTSVDPMLTASHQRDTPKTTPSPQPEVTEAIESEDNFTSVVYEIHATPDNVTPPQYFFREQTTDPPQLTTTKYPFPAVVNAKNTTVLQPLEEAGPIYPDGLGTFTYVLAFIAMVPLILGAVVVARLILGYNKKKVFDGSEYSSEYNRSPLEINGLVTSSPMTTKLPRVPQHLGWEMEKTGGLTIVPTPSSKWEFPREKLRLQTVLGQGNFGQVWKAEADDLSGHAGLTRLVAVKTVKEGASSKEREDLLRELGIMQDLGSHPNVVQLLGCCTEKEPYLLIMEYVMYGKLLSFLRDQRTRAQYYNFSDNGENLTSRDLTVFAYCVARGMDYLVSKGIIHRDLAARNVLVDHNKLCKIADFGMSRNVRDTGQIYEQRHSRGALPIRWMAPESLHYSLFTHKTDVWSFGILVWEIVTLGLTPYQSMEARDVMRRIRTGYRLERPSHCRTELYQVMVDCWRANPADRPTFAELKKALCALLENNEYEGNYVDLESLADEMHRQG
nr:PREDICTED: serine/threonine-protein kinase PAK 7-like [Bemisia tabaci]